MGFHEEEYQVRPFFFLTLCHGEEKVLRQQSVMVAGSAIEFQVPRQGGMDVLGPRVWRRPQFHELARGIRKPATTVKDDDGLEILILHALDVSRDGWAMT